MTKEEFIVLKKSSRQISHDQWETYHDKLVCDENTTLKEIRDWVSRKTNHCKNPPLKFQMGEVIVSGFERHEKST